MTYDQAVAALAVVATVVFVLMVLRRSSAPEPPLIDHYFVPPYPGTGYHRGEGCAHLRQDAYHPLRCCRSWEEHKPRWVPRKAPLTIRTECRQYTHWEIVDLENMARVPNDLFHHPDLATAIAIHYNHTGGPRE